MSRLLAAIRRFCRALLALAACAAWTAQAQPATQAPAAAASATEQAPTAKAPPPSGLHFIFDASSSMCGYLLATDPRAMLLSAIRYATTARDVERNQRVILLQQREPKASPRDLVEAPPNLQALAAGVRGNATGGCGPFSGIDSNPAVMFAAPSFAPQARSLVLVSDMQFDETALNAFHDAFRQWARTRISDQAHSVGLVSLATPFQGRYFAITEADKERRRSGYNLPQHVRPLHVLWLAVGDNDIGTVKGLLDELGVLSAARPPHLLRGQQFMPVAATDPGQWLALTAAPRTAQELLGQLSHQIKVRAQVRGADILKLCVTPALSGNDLTVKAAKNCRDGKPLFDASVEQVNISLDVQSAHGLRVFSASPAASANGKRVEIVLRRDSAPVVEVPLTLAVPETAFDRPALRLLSLDNDACESTPPPKPTASGAPAESWEQSCAKRLNARTYRYDAFVEQFAVRARALANERAESRNVSLRVRFDR